MGNNNFKQGSICIINCDPGIGREYKKIRPAIVVQANEITKKSINGMRMIL